MVTASFWDLAARINARRVLLWVCVGCVAVLGGVMLGTRTADADVVPTFLIARPAPQAPAAVATNQAPTAARPAPAADPFTSTFLHELIERAEQLRLEEEAARKRATTPPPVVAKVVPPPVQAPPRPQARLLYRGMFTRPDGTVLGLIENQRDNRTVFYRVGDEIEGLTVGAISRGTLELVQTNEVKVTLATGTPASFQPDE